MWTSLGIMRQRRVVAEAKANYDAALCAIGEEQHRESIRQEEQHLDGIPSKVEREQLYQLWKAAEVLLGRLQPIPTSISADRACSGLVVKVAHRSDEMIEKRGETEIFALGGLGEFDPDSKLRTYSINSPIGAALKGKEVGDTAVVHTPDDGHYQVEVLSLERLSVFLERLPTSLSAVADAGQLELGFCG